MAPDRTEPSVASTTPMAALLRTVAAPASWVYGLAIARRNRRFDAGRVVRRVPTPVISVGNIVVGGTGKTPTVTWLAHALRVRGFRPMIALRGYGSRDPQRADEVMEYRDALGNVPIAAGADRFGTIMRMLGEGAAAEVILLDDGFQHRMLHRDLDLVLVDARRPALDDALLPGGRLREPATSLRRASGVLVTHAKGVDARLSGLIERFHGRPPLAWLRHAWRGVEVWAVEGSPSAAAAISHLEPVAWLRGRRVVTSLGVASPARVRAMIEDAGAIVVEDVRARDHQRYDAARLRNLAATCAAERADALVVTRKDWVKLRDVTQAAPGVLGVPIVVPRLEVEFVAGEHALLAAIDMVCHRR